MTDISILLATWRRPQTLEPTLAALERLEAGRLRWQVVVVDNADDAATQSVLQRFSGRLPLEWLVESRRGKNHALNAALPRATGELIIFTDDDVIPNADWLVQMWTGAARWPAATMFTGRIRPSVGIPHDLRNNFVRCAYMVADWPQGEGPITADCVWGPNMAVRAEVFRQGAQFDVGIGPNGHDYAMGSEIEFTRRLAREGHEAVYLPGAEVVHQIRPEQLTEEWLLQRVYRSGRGVALLGGPAAGPCWLGRPRYLFREIAEGWLREAYWRLRGDDRRRLAAALERWHAWGKLRQFGLMSRETLRP